jgi:hypothetical protein
MTANGFLLDIARRLAAGQLDYTGISEVPIELTAKIIDTLRIVDEHVATRIGRLILRAMAAQHAVDVRNHENALVDDYSDCA